MIKHTVTVVVLTLLLLTSIQAAVARSHKRPAHLPAMKGLDYYKHPRAHVQNPLDGFYLGASVGIATGDGENHTMAEVDLASVAERDEVINNNLNEELHPVFGLDFGWGYVVHKYFYAGFEVFSDFRRQRSQGTFDLQQQDAAGLDFQIKNAVTLQTTGLEYGVRLRPGYLFARKTMMYLVVGWIRTRFSISSITDYFARVTADSGSAIVQASRGTSGIEVGFGIEHAFTQSVSLRAQYLYTGYSTIRLEGRGNIVGAQAQDDVINVTNLTPKKQSIVVSVNFHFA